MATCIGLGYSAFVQFVADPLAQRMRQIMPIRHERVVEKLRLSHRSFWLCGAKALRPVQ